MHIKKFLSEIVKILNLNFKKYLPTVSFSAASITPSRCLQQKSTMHISYLIANPMSNNNDSRRSDMYFIEKLKVLDLIRKESISRLMRPQLRMNLL